jgi:thiol-disulfide isomerase/thioredoxin
MSSVWKTCALGVSLAALLAPAATRAGDESGMHGPIPWTESLDAAKKTAAQQKKVILVDFWATWCGPCRQMLKTTYQDKQVVARAKQFVPVLVNFDKSPAIVKQYKIGQIPVVLFLDAKGNVLKRAQFMDAKAMLRAMDEVGKKRH